MTERRLTAAELERGKDGRCYQCRWPHSDAPCLTCRAITELRELRAEVAVLDTQITLVRADSIAIARERNQLREKNAKLVAALRDELCQLHGEGLPLSRDCQLSICARVRAALASVKGADRD